MTFRSDCNSSRRLPLALSHSRLSLAPVGHVVSADQDRFAKLRRGGVRFRPLRRRRRGARGRRPRDARQVAARAEAVGQDGGAVDRRPGAAVPAVRPRRAYDDERRHGADDGRHADLHLRHRAPVRAQRGLEHARGARPRGRTCGRRHLARLAADFRQRARSRRRASAARWRCSARSASPPARCCRATSRARSARR